ncbi:MAG: ABC transporter permease [Cyanobacteria bacterium]|nr:ABC transporter permease [Cyanobacteriota bacterium]
MSFLAWRDIAVRYKQTAIGVLWAILRPALTLLVFVAFRRMAGLRQDGTDDVVLVLAAVLPWQLFSSALSDASTSLIGNTSLISKVYFPRLIVPLSAVATALVDFLITLVLLAAVMVWYSTPLDARVLALPLFVAQCALLALGLGTLLAALTVKYRDFRYVVPFGIQLGLFVSPVGFETAQVPERWRAAYSLNPVAGIIDGFRWSLLGAPLEANVVVASMVMTVLSLVAGVWYFRRTERGFADAI